MPYVDKRYYKYQSHYLLRDINTLDFVLTDFGTMREYKEYNVEYKLIGVHLKSLYDGNYKRDEAIQMAEIDAVLNWVGV